MGNGPLSKNDRRQIQNCASVVRFNDCKNMLENERMDTHVMREEGNRHTYSGFDSCKLKDDSQMNIVLVGNDADLDLKETPNVTERIKLNGTSRKVFETCSKSRDSDIEKWPTTGTMYLSELEQRDNVGKIHVYGMNWNMKDSVHSSAEGKLVKTCCTKCHIHRTPNKTYLP